MLVLCVSHRLTAQHKKIDMKRSFSLRIDIHLDVRVCEACGIVHISSTLGAVRQVEA